VGKRRQRRAWSDDEKRVICAQARMPGLSVSQVARRYDVNANLVFKWLRDSRFASAETDDAPPGFLPVNSCPITCQIGVAKPTRKGGEPFAYLKATLTAIANGHPQSHIDDLLPWNFKPSS
jgi:transposase